MILILSNYGLQLKLQFLQKYCCNLKEPNFARGNKCMRQFLNRNIKLNENLNEDENLNDNEDLKKSKQAL